MSKLDQEFFWVCISVLVLSANPRLVAAVVIAENCELSFLNRNTIYNYSLASPISKYPHGALSEDGYYKVAVNETLLWFQLCEDMIFNHDPPHCYGCQDCGGPSQCGTKCSALVATEEGGYPVCKTIGHATHTVLSLIDEKYPQKGITVKMYASMHKRNCSLSVSVLCDSKEARVPSSLQLLGDCDYVTELRHPSGCAKTISSNGSGLGWFGTLLTIVLCVLGGYLVVGTIYRFYFLGIHGLEAIPNLEFWLSLPRRAKALLGSLVRKLRGNQAYSRGSYSPLDS